MRSCKVCRQRKSDKEFKISPFLPGGREPVCATCRDANPKIKAQIQRYANQAERKAHIEATHEHYTITDIIMRDGTQCALCHKEIQFLTPTNRLKKPSAAFHVDHIIPIAEGGPDRLDNVQLTHPECNLKKGKSTIGVAGYVSSETGNIVRPAPPKNKSTNLNTKPIGVQEKKLIISRLAKGVPIKTLAHELNRSEQAIMRYMGEARKMQEHNAKSTEQIADEVMAERAEHGFLGTKNNTSNPQQVPEAKTERRAHHTAPAKDSIVPFFPPTPRPANPTIIPPTHVPATQPSRVYDSEGRKKVLDAGFDKAMEILDTIEDPKNLQYWTSAVAILIDRRRMEDGEATQRLEISEVKQQLEKKLTKLRENRGLSIVKNGTDGN